MINIHMKKYIFKTLFTSVMALMLFAGHSIQSHAAELMPCVNPFTYAASGAADLPAATPYSNMLVADVSDFVNVRQSPDTESGIAGRLYDGAAANIIRFSPEDDAWVEILSGTVTGFVKAEFFLFGADAAAAIETTLSEGGELTYAKSMEDIWAEIAAAEAARRQKAQEEAKRLAAAKAAENTSAAASADSEGTVFGDTTELRQSIADFAMQYLGGPYVHGGNSLTEGTDCSGFTSLIFAEFGYSLSRTPSGQLSKNGTKIEYSEIRPGDIICYTSNGKTCTHVALYIGDGLIIHAANSKKGIITNNADYSTIMAVKNIIG